MKLNVDQEGLTEFSFSWERGKGEVNEENRLGKKGYIVIRIRLASLESELN